MYNRSLPRKNHPILESDAYDAELSELPHPPNDLPKPWVAAQWMRVFGVAFVASTFLLWWIGGYFDILIMNEFSGACVINFGPFLVIGLVLLGKFTGRGYHSSYNRKANKALNKGIMHYRRKDMGENLHQMLASYLIEGQAYYFVWYVPGSGTVHAARLAPGSEPLLFDRHGHWIDDEVLFNKALLMWSHSLDFRSGSGPNRHMRDYNGLRKLLIESLSLLPSLLETNQDQFSRHNLAHELSLLQETYHSKCGIYRNTMQLILRKGQWALAHGQTSIHQLRYKDVLAYQNADALLVQKREAFIKKYRIREAEEIALEIHGLTNKRGNSHGWRKRKALDSALQVFAAPIPDVENHFTLQDGLWVGPQDSLKGYRSRLAYAREVDAERARKQALARAK